MLRHFPGRTELFLFAAMSVVCVGGVHVIGAHDTGLSLLSIPIFISCAILGMWKSGRLRAGDDSD